ncbi:hypothetical protein NLX86_29610 [Streptomyces sp. A3M-1-3]|uniref:hypothetical protein n=1 Tax=Streptomyces sp. A3M-1-3 TaxID=2962044 RepID=UPI0020B8C8A7|nr:hypothetical protein [Streptomyces sp. A3M-1-3]MCP3822095.1 hypothetical protein [Streptomyces sp. A3M-1-3]
MESLYWIWVIVSSAVALPFGIALLGGWAPEWIRKHSSAGGIRVQGIATLIMYVALLVPVAVELSSMDQADAEFFMPLFLFLGIGLMYGAKLCDRFNSKAEQAAWLARQDSPQEPENGQES